MSLLEQYQLEYTLVEGDTPVVAAVIVAAGSGSRMGCDKQLMPLLGIPVLARTLLAFQECEIIRDIIVVTKEQQIADVQTLADTYNITKMKAVVAGGKERQESVENGIRAIANDTVYVAIHDGARPLITPEEIEKVVSVAGEKGAAALAVPVKDTIKRIDHNNKIVETPLRATLMAVQTPQVFDVAIYMKALENAKSIGSFVTDDCQMVEAIDYPVYTVNGSYRNIKITTPDDIALAELLLKQEDDHD